MHNARPFLGPALALSIALHAALMALGLQESPRVRPPLPPELKVRLSALPAVPETLDPPAPRLTLPAQPQRNAIATAPRAAVESSASTGARAPAAEPRGDASQRLSGEAALRAAEQLARELPYPPEAVERGLQGEALVMIFLDGSGDAIAARLEASSGHAILDEAAVRAARQLKALPSSAPREALLPVRFRLRQ